MNAILVYLYLLCTYFLLVGNFFSLILDKPFKSFSDLILVNPYILSKGDPGLKLTLNIGFDPPEGRFSWGGIFLLSLEGVNIFCLGVGLGPILPFGDGLDA